MIPSLPVEFVDNSLKLLDQTRLPLEEVYVKCENIEDVHQAIIDMIVRGAPCIGYSGIYGLALKAKALGNSYSHRDMVQAASYLKSARPTAVNLAYEIDQSLELISECNSWHESFRALIKFGNSKINKSENDHRKMAAYFIDDLDKRVGKEKYNILTHCNTGFLACGSTGTALGAIQVLGELDRISNVLVDETRPYLQGLRLTSFELTKLNIPHQIVVEGAASYLMKNKLVDAVIVGADRIVKNGDTANKIGTSNLSIIADHYGIPFYVLAPTSSFDLNMDSGDSIEIELRNEDEILTVGGKRMAPEGARALNPSFDITSGQLITSIISERNAYHPPYLQSLGEMNE